MLFRDLQIGQSFDFVEDDAPAFMNFDHSRYVRTSARLYSDGLTLIRVGSIRANVYHVGSASHDLPFNSAADVLRQCSAILAADAKRRERAEIMQGLETAASGFGRNVIATIFHTLRMSEACEALTARQIDDLAASIGRQLSRADWIDVCGLQFDIAPLSRDLRGLHDRRERVADMARRLWPVSAATEDEITRIGQEDDHGQEGRTPMLRQMADALRELLAEHDAADHASINLYMRGLPTTGGLELARDAIKRYESETPFAFMQGVQIATQRATMAASDRNDGAPIFGHVDAVRNARQEG